MRRVYPRATAPPNKPLQRPNARVVRLAVRLCRDGAGCARASSLPCYARGDRSPLNGRSLYGSEIVAWNQGELTMAPVSVRYIVHDVDAAVAFYTQRLGFSVELRPAPGFAVVSRGDLRLLLSAPTGLGGAAQPMPDGRKPEPG